MVWPHTSRSEPANRITAAAMPTLTTVLRYMLSMEAEPDDGHIGPHRGGHVSPGLARPHVIEAEGVQIHQAEHDDR